MPKIVTVTISRPVPDAPGGRERYTTAGVVGVHPFFDVHPDLLLGDLRLPAGWAAEANLVGRLH